MDEKRVYPRITITLEPGVLAKLPKRDRSAFINLILRQHFQNEGLDRLFEAFKDKLIRDEGFNKWLETTVREVQRYERRYTET